MTEILGIISIVTSIASICGVICALVVATRNKKKDDVSDGQNIGILHTDVGYIKKGIEGIERHLEKIDEQYIDVIMQLTEVKGEVKRHTKRIEKLESYHDPKGDKTNG